MEYVLNLFSIKGNSSHAIVLEETMARVMLDKELTAYYFFGLFALAVAAYIFYVYRKEFQSQVLLEILLFSIGLFNFLFGIAFGYAQPLLIASGAYWHIAVYLGMICILYFFARVIGARLFDFVENRLKKEQIIKIAKEVAEEQIAKFKKNICWPMFFCYLFLTGLFIYLIIKINNLE